jgi:phosphohistidine phosphatase
MGFHLYIMRHAKSDWSGQNTSDFDRPINNRGQENAKLIGQWMMENDHLPEKIMSSPAFRARQTTDLVIEELGSHQVKVDYDNDLYLASIDILMECVQLYKNDVNSLMLVAHNPGLEQLVNELLIRSGNIAARGKTMTTANLAIFEYKDSHFDPEKDKGELIAFIKPKELD